VSMNGRRVITAFLWLLWVCGWAQQSGKGVSLLLVALVSHEEQQYLVEDIAKFEAHAWDIESLDQQMNEWASRRNLVLHKTSDTGFYLAVSQRLVRDSFYGERLTVAQMLSNALEQSQAIAVHKQPEPLRKVLERTAIFGQPHPMVFLRVREASPRPKYLMPGGLVYVEVPIDEDEPVQVGVQSVLPYPQQWGNIDTRFPNPPSRQPEKPAEELTESMVIVRSPLAAVGLDRFTNALKRLIDLWVRQQELVREQYEREVQGLRDALKQVATEQVGLPLDTELDWSVLPPELAETVLKKLQQAGYDVSPASLAGKRIRLGIALRLQVAYIDSDVVVVEERSFGGDFGASVFRTYPKHER
jgi:hypothetical protein